MVLGVTAFGAETETGVVDRIVERRFAVGDHASLSLETFYGPVKVSVGEGADAQLIRVTVRESIDANTEAEADRELKNFDLAIEEKTPGKIEVRAKERRSIRWSWQKWPPIGLEFEVSVPRQCVLKIFSHDGAISVQALVGSVDLTNDAGPITVGMIAGNLSVKAARGDVAITGCSGELNVRAEAGNVMIGRAEGKTLVQGTNGSIEVQKSHGNLTARGDGSDLKIGFAYPINGDATVSAAGGDISASFEEKISADLAARASTFGEVRGRDLKMKITRGGLGKSSLEAQLNQGGPLISLHASGGNIRLLTVPDI
jgi:hypothetical protein